MLNDTGTHSMDQHLSRDTNNYAPNRAQRQGRFTLTALNNILVCKATGPFNDQLVEALAATEYGMLAELNSMGKWADIIEFRNSAYASAFVMESFRYYLQILVKQGIIATATALIVPLNILARVEMVPAFVGAYESNGLMIRVFEEFDDGMDWVVSALDG